LTSTDSAAITVMPVERKDGTYTLRLCLCQGEMTFGMIKRVMEVMGVFNLTTLRATTGQRMNLEGIPKDRLEEVVAALGTAVEKCPPGVSVCPGGGICKYGVQESRELGKKLEAVIKQNGPYPFKIKSGVSGCRMGCGLSFVRDIGLVARPKGWDLYFGGSAVGTAAPGVLLGNGLDSDEILDIVTRALAFYKENALKRERIGKMVQRLGHEAVSAALR
jgi:NAD(P)H-nitrite reductase large subunit